MDRDQYRALIEAVVQAVLARLSGNAIAPEPLRPFLVVLCGGGGSQAGALQLITALAARGPIQVVATRQYRSRHDLAALRAALPGEVPLLEDMSLASQEDALRSCAGLVLLQPLRSTLAAAARGIARRTQETLLVDALAAGISVFAAGGDAHPDAWPSTTPATMRRGPGSLGEAAERDLEALKSWGLVHRREPAELYALAIEAWKLPPTSPSTGADAAPFIAQGDSGPLRPASGFLTAEDVRALHRDGKRHIALSPETRITDAAHEEAARLSVTISR